MLRLLVALALIVIAGCEDFKQAMESDTGRKPMTPAGIATTEDVDTLGARDKTPAAPAEAKPAESKPGATRVAEAKPAQASKPGTTRVAEAKPAEATTPGKTRVTDAKPAETKPDAPAEPAADPAVKAAPTTGKQRVGTATPKPEKGIIGKTTAKVVDAQKAKQNPKVVEVENKISGSDPLTVSASAYISITSRASTLGFRQALQHHKALEGKNPTYDEFEQIVKQNRVEFAALPPYQMYGYDAQKGGIVILEDKAEKIRLYKQQGIPIEPEDKKYE